MFTAQTYRSNIPDYIRKCILIAILGFFVLTGVMFFSTYVVGHDGIEFFVITEGVIPFLLAPNESTAKWWEVQRELHHFNDPLIVQYGRWMWDILSGDWGNSYYYQIPVRDLLF